MVFQSPTEMDKLKLTFPQISLIHTALSSELWIAKNDKKNVEFSWTTYDELFTMTKCRKVTHTWKVSDTCVDRLDLREF